MCERINVSCPVCNARMAFSAEHLDSRAKCRKCGFIFSIGKTYREQYAAQYQRRQPPVLAEQIKRTAAARPKQYIAPWAACIASFFLAGLGQLLQGRYLLGALMMVGVVICYGTLILLPLGFVIGIVSMVDAWVYNPNDPNSGLIKLRNDAVMA